MIATGAGNVVAVGVDIVEVGRVRDALARFPKRFARRVLTDAELEYCASRRDPAPHVAARFAAKEAVIKCLGGSGSFVEIEVARALSGAPSVVLFGGALAKAGVNRILISLSHTDTLATAFAVLVTPE